MNETGGTWLIFLVKIVSGIIFVLVGLLVFYKSIKTIRRDGLSVGFIEIVSGIVLLFIGILIFLGYFS